MIRVCMICLMSVFGSGCTLRSMLWRLLFGCFFALLTGTAYSRRCGGSATSGLSACIGRWISLVPSYSERISLASIPGCMLWEFLVELL